MLNLDGAHALGLMVAGGSGLLIGLERERRKGQGQDREAAGIRSFTLVALAGGLAQALQQPALVALGAALVAVLSALAYWRSRRPDDSRTRLDADPGLSTELALFVTYLVGVLGVQQPVLGAGAAVVVAALLAARERLHRFARRALSDAELHDALLLAALALVLLPLAPAAPLPWLAGLAPRTLLLLVVLILALQAAGHVALRLLGPRTGLALSGLLSGFVSSTATIASLGARARALPEQRAACLAGAVWSTAATWLQAVVMLTALAPAAAAALLPVAATGAAVAVAVGALWLRRAGAAGGEPATVAAVATQPSAQPVTRAAEGSAADLPTHLPTHAAADPAADPSGAASGAAYSGLTDVAPEVPHPPGPLRLREALWVVLLLSVVAVAVGWAQQRFGDAGLWVGTALSAVADAHASVVALGALQATGQLTAAQVVTGVLVAVAANALTRSLTGVVAGGRAYGSAVALALLLSTAAAAGSAWWWV